MQKVIYTVTYNPKTNKYTYLVFDKLLNCTALYNAAWDFEINRPKPEYKFKITKDSIAITCSNIAWQNLLENCDIKKQLYFYSPIFEDKIGRQVSLTHAADLQRKLHSGMYLKVTDYIAQTISYQEITAVSTTKIYTRKCSLDYTPEKLDSHDFTESQIKFLRARNLHFKENYARFYIKRHLALDLAAYWPIESDD